MSERLLKPINDAGDLEKVDADSFRFHIPMKGLFYRMLNFINPPPKAWVDDIDGNMGILRDIYREYEHHEKQEWRRNVMSRVFPFSLCLSHYDKNYEEVMQWFIYRIIQEQDKFKFTFVHKHPMFWALDGKGRKVFTEEEIATIEAHYGKKE